MSYLTHRADFLDFYEMSNNKKEFIKNLELYVDNIKVVVNNETDLIPYYPFLISSSSTTPSKIVVNLTKCSYIDTLELDIISLMIYFCVKQARKHKNDKYKILVDKDFVSQLHSYPESILILDIILENKLTNKIPLFNKDNAKFYRYCSNWLIPEYFSSIRTYTANNLRIKWLELAKDNNYIVSLYNADKNEFIRYNEDGIYSKIINDAVLKIYFYVNFLKKKNSLKTFSI